MKESLPEWGVAKETLFVAAVMVVFLVLTRVISRGVRWYGTKLPATIEPQKNFVPLVAQLLDTVLLILACTVLIHHFGVEPLRFFQGLAIFALAVSLSLKASVENFIAGYLILFGRPFRPHDRIKLLAHGIEIEGEVLGIGKRATRLLTDDGVVFVPNADLVNWPVVNLTLRSRHPPAEPPAT
jgi:small-conductance mechanosensitive channel